MIAVNTLRQTSAKRKVPYMAIPLGLLVILLIVNTILEPNFWSITILSGTLASAAPLVLAAIAETPAILVGNGGLDISIGPLMSLINVIVVTVVVSQGGHGSPVEIIGLALLIGLASGLLNGSLVGFLNVQPIVVTLGTYMVYLGLATQIMQSPGGTIPEWLSGWTANIGPIPTSAIVILVILAVWFLLSRTRFFANIYAIGGDERAAYASGVPVAWEKLGAFALTGLLGAVAALMLTAEIASGIGYIGTPYTLTAIAAVVLGGTSLTGGRGGVLGSLTGAFVIFLIKNAIGVGNLSVFYQDIFYGVILIGSITLNAVTARWRGGGA